MTEEQQSLSARQLLEQTFDSLKNKLDGKEIKLPSEVWAEIANDSDWHRTRIGYTCYKSATLLKIGGKEWAIAFGTKTGSYPADPYNCDIAVVLVSTDEKPEKEMTEEICKALEKGSYFRNSLIYAMADGQLRVREGNLFSRRIVRLIKPKFVEFITQGLEIDHAHIYLDGRPIVKSGVQYKPEFVDFLFDTFHTVLAS